MQPDLRFPEQLERIENQLRTAEECRSRLAQIQQQLVDLAEDKKRQDQERQQLAEQQLETRLQQVRQHAEQHLDTLRLDAQTRTVSLENSYNQNHRSLKIRVEEGLAKLQERRESETWILQSVFDEDTQDSPVKEFERAADSYVSQKQLLDERIDMLNQQIDSTGKYLRRCHAGMEAELPPPKVANKNIEAAQQNCVEQGDALVEVANNIAGLHLPSLTAGARLWGFGILCALVLCVPIIAIKVPPQHLIDPELHNPDFQWVGVATLIAFVSAGIIGLILMLIVQSKLRSRFEAMLQHASNATASRNQWDSRSQKKLNRLDKAAEKWRTELEATRNRKQQLIQTEIANEESSLQQELQQKGTAMQAEYAQQTAQIASLLKTEEDQTYTNQETELQQVRHEFDAQQHARQTEADERFKTQTLAIRKAAEETRTTWTSAVQQLRSLAQDSQAFAAATRHWPSAGWRLPESMPHAMSVGDLLVTAPGVPADSDTPAQSSPSLCIEMPAVIPFPQDCALLVEHDSAGRDLALSFLRRQILKLLTIIPPGRIRLTLIDPIGLGQSFAAMMHLADFDELLIHSRIWTDASQIREQLHKVTEHMENIFQTYLRSQFETIEDYNVSAGEVAEPYHFVVVAGFPAAFTEESARYLSSILTSGPRCGVHSLVAWNPQTAPPPTFDIDDLTNNCGRFIVRNNAIQPHTALPGKTLFEVYPEPPAEQYVQLVRDAGEQSKDARRVEVSFTRISPREDEIWSNSTAEGIDLPIGRAGAARLQYMRLGRGTSQHMLVAGKTGSGKSTLLHIMITNLALHYSPDEIQFYLIDFKKGVEFRTYASNRLPHARVVAIESDREFGLSVLEKLDSVLQDRGEMFRERGVQDVPSFREQFPTEPMPRLLLLIDEFQEFFVAEDRVSARASLLLDRLVRQGRAFGIHVMLGSQTLGGAYSLARSTMGQIAVRIALQCSDNDAHLILSEDNTAARLLTRPGEAIYNDANGMASGNHQFQIAWLDEQRRETAIETMLQRPDIPKDHSMVVFEGNVPPTVDLCSPLVAQLQDSPDATRRTHDATTIWLGEPVAIAAPTSVELRRASGQNVLMVGSDEKRVDALLATMMLSLAKRSEEAASITFLQDGRNAESVNDFAAFTSVLNGKGVNIRTAGPTECDSIVEELLQLVEAREENAELATQAEQILIVRNIGQFRSLRKDEDDFSLGGFGEPKEVTIANKFGDVIKRGSLVGVYVIVWSDTFSNAVRWLSSSLLREFENRIAFRMNQTDSASLVDSPIASSLGAGRALLYRDQTGTAEKFRPFAWPDNAWLKTALGNPGKDAFDIDSLTIE